MISKADERTGLMIEVGFSIDFESSLSDPYDKERRG